MAEGLAIAEISADVREAVAYIYRDVTVRDDAL